MTPTEINAFPRGSELIFTFSYNGESRIPTKSGRQPNITGLGININANRIQFTKNENSSLMMNGGDTQVMTLTLPATSEYPEATATLTFTNCDASDFKDI